MKNLRSSALGCLLVLSIAGSAGAQSLPADHTEWCGPVFDAAYKLLASPAEWEELHGLSRHELADYLARFWKRRDPTPTTPINEFKEQFEARVELALTRYRCIPQPSPWDARGDVVIKFGWPDDIQQGVNVWYSRADRGPFFDDIRTYGELWYYFSRNLKLQFQYLDTRCELVPFGDFTGESDELWEYAETVTRVETTTVAYTLPDGVEDLDVSLDCYPFRRTDGNYDVYVACALPLRSVGRFNGRRGDVRYVARVTAMDSTLRLRWADSVRVERHVDHAARGMLAQNQWETVMPPGFYVLTAEIADDRGKKHAVGSFDRWLVPYVDSAMLELSPLVIAADVRNAGEGASAFVRNGKEVIPMPGRVFRNDQDVAFYHEVYNLTRDGSGLCHYRVEYSIWDRDRREHRTLAARNLESIERETYQAGRIPHTLLDKGSYILQVKTEDLNSGSVKTALAQLKVE